MKWLVLGLVLAVGLALGPVAHAQDATNDTMTIRAKAGDTLELLAAEYYGDRTRAVFIMTENHIVHPRPLKVGERLRIPVSRDITTAPGDTFTSLAGTYLGDPKRAPFLAEFNGMMVDDNLAGGTSLSIPFTVMHTAAATETLASIAAAYFGDSKNGEMLQRYNFLDKTSIDKDETIIVPVYNVRIIASKMPPLDAESKQRRERQRAAADHVVKAMPVAMQAWRAGEFARVKAELARVEPDLEYLDAANAIDVGVLLGATHVAFDDIELALASFTRVLARKPHHALSAYWFSPKILAVWKKAGGQVE